MHTDTVSTSFEHIISRPSAPPVANIITSGNGDIISNKRHYGEILQFHIRDDTFKRCIINTDDVTYYTKRNPSTGQHGMWFMYRGTRIGTSNPPTLSSPWEIKGITK